MRILTAFLIFTFPFLSQAQSINMKEIKRFFEQLDKVVQAKDKDKFSSFFASDMKLILQIKGRPSETINRKKMQEFNFAIWDQAEEYSFSHGNPSLRSIDGNQADVSVTSTETVKIPGKSIITKSETAIFTLEKSSGKIVIKKIVANDSSTE